MFLTLLVYLAYIVIWILLVIAAGVFSWRYKKSKLITVVAAFLAFLAMYWPAFGDYIPAVVAHKHYCETEAGFKIYVTPEQWAAENPGVLETLVPYKKFTPYEHMVLGNERIAIKSDMSWIGDVAVRREVEYTLDIQTKKILAESVDFSRGYGVYALGQDPRAIKMWLYLGSCFTNQELRENSSKKIEFFKKLNTKWGN